jgi:glutathione S-transferase
MKLYGTRQSPFDRKVLVVLVEKGIPYETEHLAPAPKTPELLALHPMGKIPILRDGDVVVPDSSVICAYLEKKHPAPALYPHAASAVARSPAR